MSEEEESSAERSKKRAEEAGKALASSSDNVWTCSECGKAVPEQDRRGDKCKDCEPDDDGGYYPQQQEPKDTRSDTEKAVDAELDKYDAWKNENPEGTLDDYKADKEAKKEEAENAKFDAWKENNPGGTKEDYEAQQAAEKKQKEIDKLNDWTKENPDGTIAEFDAQQAAEKEKEAEKERTVNDELGKYDAWRNENPDGTREDFYAQRAEEKEKEAEAKRLADEEAQAQTQAQAPKDATAGGGSALGDFGDQIADDAPKPQQGEQYSPQGQQYLYDQTEGGTKGFDLAADQQGYDDSEKASPKGNEQGEDDGINANANAFQDKQFGAPNTGDPLSGGRQQGADGNNNQAQPGPAGAPAQAGADGRTPAAPAAGNQPQAPAAGQESAQKPGGNGSEDEGGGPPPEGWFGWLERTWKKLAAHPATGALCKPLNIAVREGIGAASAGIAYALALYPGYMAETIGALFNILNDLDDPLKYSLVILAGAGLIMGGPLIVTYTALRPVQKLRQIIDFVLKLPPVNKLLLQLKKAYDKLQKAMDKLGSVIGAGALGQRVNQALSGDVKGAFQGAAGDAKDRIKSAPRNAANSVKNAPRNAANAIKNAPRNIAGNVKDKLGDLRDNTIGAYNRARDMKDGLPAT